MYTEGAQTTRHYRFLQHTNTPNPCSCQHCVYHEQFYHSGPGFQQTSARQTAHSFHDHRGDIQTSGTKDVGGRTFIVDRFERSGYHSPQRRPVFTGPGHYTQLDNFSQVCTSELNPGFWGCPPEHGVSHYLSVREQCGCVMRGDTREHPFNTGNPHPLPHLQVKGQGYRRTVRYVSIDKEEEDGCKWTFENCSLESHTPIPDGLMSNGHGGLRAADFEGGEERDIHQCRGKLMGGSQEVCNGRSSTHKGIFPTEVPQKHFNQSRKKGPFVPRSGSFGPEPSKTNCSIMNDYKHQHSDTQQKTTQDSVRDQIRQVVTDLEDVLGGLKQVHMEMKEVVKQIDRLTASIDFSGDSLSINQGPTSFQGLSPPGDLKAAQLPNHKSALISESQQYDQDRIILRTNSPSPVHMASVVKTSCFIPPSLNKDINHSRPDVNGHPPHLHPHRHHNHTGNLQTQPQSLDPKVITWNSTCSSRTQKPPLYPQNGRCGKGSYPPSKPSKTPAYTVKDRQSTSMV